MNWLTVVIVALICGAVVDIYDRGRKNSAFALIYDRGRKNSAFALALLFAVIVGSVYTFFLYLEMFVMLRGL